MLKMMQETKRILCRKISLQNPPKGRPPNNCDWRNHYSRQHLVTMSGFGRGGGGRGGGRVGAPARGGGRGGFGGRGGRGGRGPVDEGPPAEIVGK